MSANDPIKSMTTSLKQLDIKSTFPLAKEKNHPEPESASPLSISSEYPDSLPISEKIEALQNSEARSISFHSNRLSAEEKENIFTKLSKNKTLEKLNLAAVRLTEEEAVKLATALEGNQSLEVLDVSFNRIGNKGALAILEATTALKTLSLRGTVINDNFAKKFPNNKRVQAIKLNLAENFITEEGALAVFETLNAFSLKSLLVGNVIKDKELRKDIREADDNSSPMDIESSPQSSATNFNSAQ